MSPAQTDTKKSSSNSWNQTWPYVGGAAVMLAITGGIELFSRPAPIKEYGKVGEQFYADFVDPTLATSLDVSVFDTDAVKPVEFRVQRLENGRWVIPSHHNYPADAEEQLAKTASSVIGITRGAMVTRWEADHSRYGVVNPRQESLKVGEVAGIGQRITLRKEDDRVLADYIVGNPVDGETGQFYVRHPEEDEVYIAKLDVDISTKFSDWIDTDLFSFTNGDILNLTINDYSFNELNGSLTKGDTMQLSREKAYGDDWKLDSLNEETEELVKESITSTLSAIADLEVAGVRPKQKGLTPELQLDRATLQSQQGVNRLQQDLLERGFLLQPGETEGSLTLISREGELYAGTEDGLRYRMYFGRVFTGTEEELEIGFAAAGAEETKSEPEPGEPESGEPKEDDADAEAEEPTGKPGRYLFVRVDFDKSLLGEEFGSPVEPQKPARLTELEEAEKADEGKDPAKDDEAKEEPAKAEGEAEGEAEETEETELEKLRREFSDAQNTYREDKRKFEDYQEKTKEGQEKAEELNRRFADWYYVIPGDSFDKLKLGRADLVKTKEVEEAAVDTEAGAPQTTTPPAADVTIPEASSADIAAEPSAKAEEAEPANEPAADQETEESSEEEVSDETDPADQPSAEEATSSGSAVESGE